MYFYPPPPKKHKKTRVLTCLFQQKAFTLAEVLITLTIVGLVAAMTLPNLITKVQDYGFRSAFLKQYTLIKQAHQLSIRNDEDFNAKVSLGTISEPFRENPNLMKNYFKIAKGPYSPQTGAIYTLATKLYNLKSSAELDKEIKYLNGTTGYWKNASLFSFQTTDGTIIIFHITHCHENSIYIDVNGAKKPNTFGRDIYLVEFTGIGNSPIKNSSMFGQILPNGAKGTQACGGNLYQSEANNCKKNSTGLTCANEILKNRGYVIK